MVALQLRLNEKGGGSGPMGIELDSGGTGNADSRSELVDSELGHSRQCMCVNCHMSRCYNSVQVYFLIVDMAPKKGPWKKRKQASGGMHDSFGIDPSDDTFLPETSDPDEI
jgi:hypothetical protein